MLPLALEFQHLAVQAQALRTMAATAQFHHEHGNETTGGLKAEL